MEEYREFIVTLRELELQDVYILLHKNMTPTLGKYVKMVRDLKYEDGTYHTYYGGIKKIISSFTAYFNAKIDKTIREVDKYMQVSTKEIIMELCETTIDKYKKKQQNFEFEFLPVRCPAEKDIYDRIKKKMVVFIEKLNDMRNRVSRLDKQFKVDAFAKQVLPEAIPGDAEKFKFAHQFLSRMLAARVINIDRSISEINIRVCHAFKKMQSSCEEAINTLIHQLYSVNKEALRVSRRYRRCTIDHAEVDKSIMLIREKIDKFHPNDTPLRRLEEEVTFWTRKYQEIDYIATPLAKLKCEKEDLLRREQEVRLISRQEHCSCNSDKFEDIVDEIFSLIQIQHRIKETDKQYDEVSRCLFTFFSLRGSNLIYYHDQVGQYFIDEYGHKIYSFDFGLELRYLQKDGTLVDSAAVENKYFDEYGKYIYEDSHDGASVSASCVSMNSSSNESLLFGSLEDVLVTQRSMHVKSKAKLDKKPEHMDINIKNKLDGETIAYLWDAVGSILPDALFDTYSAKPKNPINYLAYKLLKHKYSRSNAEAKAKREEADKYRADFLKQKQDEAKEEARAFKSRLVKPRKPEESYDLENQMIDAFHVAQHDFIMGMNFSDAM